MSNTHRTSVQRAAWEEGDVGGVEEDRHSNEVLTHMSGTTLLGVGVPTCMLFAGAAVLYSRRKTAPSFLQLIGAACLMVVMLAHVSEALHLFPWMQWGQPQSIGHYLDLWSAILGLTLFPLGYLAHAIALRRGALVSPP